MSIEVYAFNADGRPRYLGEAASFGQARKMQLDALPEDLRAAYAGFQDGCAVFYTHMLTDELRAKYPSLGGE